MPKRSNRGPFLHRSQLGGGRGSKPQVALTTAQLQVYFHSGAPHPSRARWPLPHGVGGAGYRQGPRTPCRSGCPSGGPRPHRGPRRLASRRSLGGTGRVLLPGEVPRPSAAPGAAVGTSGSKPGAPGLG